MINSDDFFKLLRGHPLDSNFNFEKSHEILNLINNHGMSGVVYSQFQKNGKILDQLFPIWKMQMGQNAFHVAALKELSEHISTLKSPPLFVKGMALIEDLYTDWGTRFMSDVDILVAETDKENFEAILKKLGWVEMPFHKWEYNKNKTVFLYEKSGWSCLLEVHYMSPSWTKEGFLPSQNVKGFYRQGPEQTLDYLIEHLARHTFMSLHWLWDIYLFSKKYPQIYKAKEENSKITAREKQVLNAVKLIDSADDKLNFSLVNRDFLIRPHGSRFRYYAVKHLLSPSLFQAIRYDWIWLMQKGWKSRN